jgi:hypothetical protein
VSARLRRRLGRLERRNLRAVPMDLRQADLRRHQLFCLSITPGVDGLSPAQQAELDYLNRLLAREDPDRDRWEELGFRYYFGPELTADERRELEELDARCPLDPNDPLAPAMAVYGRVCGIDSDP